MSSLVLGRRDGRRGRLADDGQDRALDRLGDRAVRGPAPSRERMGEVEAVEPPLPAEAVGHPAEDLARDDARVAPGAHQRAEADRGGDAVGRLAGHALGLVERRTDRRQHVRARVAVGDREDVEGVDLVDVGLEVGDGGPEGLEEPGPVTGPAHHQATSVPLSARSRSGTAAGSCAGIGGGSAAGWSRRPSMWITRWRTSRPSERSIA